MVRPFLQEGAEGKYWYGWEEVGYIIGSFTTLNLREIDQRAKKRELTSLSTSSAATATSPATVAATVMTQGTSSGHHQP